MKRHFLLSVALLFCAIVGASRAHAQTQWNTNLLQNTVPTTGSQYKGWEKTESAGYNTHWGIDKGWFVASWLPCALKQTVTLADYGFTADDLSGQRLYASTQYEIPNPGTIANGGTCVVAVVCLDGSGVALDTLYLLNMQGYTNLEIRPTLKDSTFALPAGTAQLRYELHGKDQLGWSGTYGPKFTDMVIMVLKRDLTYTASVDPALGDSITLSKTSGIHALDTIEVSATYPEYPIKNLVVEGDQHRIEGNKVICRGGDMIVGAQLLHPHAITPNTPYATITPSKTSAYVGDIITLSHTMKEGYRFVGYTATPEVGWPDATHFIMPDEAVEIGMEAVIVHTIPFFEGFEEGNQDYKTVRGWLQQDETGNSSEAWKANSDTAYNRTPYAGSWNATFPTYTTAWLFSLIRLEAGVQYRISMYARQNNTTKANLSVYLGDDTDKDAMTLNIIPETAIANGDYQHLTAVFTVPESKDYALGIQGETNAGTRYISVDNISITRDLPNEVRFTSSEAGSITADKTSATVGDTITLSHSMNAGHIFIRYTADTDVHWLDQNRFIMPEKDVEIGMEAITSHTVPFFEGFEQGNTNDSVVSGWLQQPENNSPVWLAAHNGRNYNSAPFAGEWNAYLLNKSTCWLYKGLRLEAGVEYRISMFARQYATTEMTIAAYLGDAFDKDAMTLDILPETEITGGDYQHLTATFTVPESKDYVLGIRGYKQEAYYFLVIDNISVTRNLPSEVHITQPTMGTITADKTSAMVGDTVTLSYTLSNLISPGSYTTNVDVAWVADNRFIMPVEDVTVALNINPDSLITRTPFFEGFEEGNTAGEAVSGWAQYSEGGSREWRANQGSEYNTSPYQGAWNAILMWGNTDWLFRWVYLESGKTYRLAMYARQNESNTNYAKLSAYIGNAQDKDSMRTAIIPETGLTDGDYQLLANTFSVAESNVYALGIRGTLDGHPFYISLDNISLGEYITHTIRTTNTDSCTLTVDKTEAYAGDTVCVNATANAGYVLDSVSTDVLVERISETCFIMPDEDVVLTAYTRRLRTGVLQIISTDKVSAYATRNGVELPNISIVSEGDTICTTVVAAPGYKLDGISPDDATQCVTIGATYFINDSLIFDAGEIDVLWVGLQPRVECPDSTTAIVKWDNAGCEYDVVIADKEITNFTFQKGIRHTADTAYTMQGLTAGKTYYAYLHGDKAGEEEIWNSTGFVMLPDDANESCTLTIDCHDSYGDGWNGNKLRIKENGQTTRITMDDGKSETFTYRTQGGKVAIYWEEGSFSDEVSFKITNANGDVLVEINGAASLEDGVRLFSGNPCNICTQPVITGINRQGTDITVSWANTDAASYNVALLNTNAATDEELAAQQINTTDTMYTFHNVDTYKFYTVYVQAQCNEKSTSDWIIDYYVAQPATPLQWEPITLNFHIKGDDAIANGKAYPRHSAPCLLYRLTLSEAQTVYGYTTVDGNYSGMMLAPLKDDTLDMTQVRMLTGDTAQLAVGDYGIVCGVMPGYEYEVFIAKADTMQFTPVTLPYLSDTIMNNRFIDDNTVGNGFFRGYEFTLNKTTTLEMSLKDLDLAQDSEAYIALWRYENGQNNPIDNFMRQVQPLDSGTYRIGVFTDNENVPYRLSITDSLPSFAFDTIVADTLLTGTISTTDGLYPSPIGVDFPGKAYTFTLESEQFMTALLYATRSDSVIVTFYTDSLLMEDDEVMEAAGMNDSTFYTGVRNWYNTPQRYYMVVYNLTEQEQSFTCVLHTSPTTDSVPTSDTMRVAEPKMIAFDAQSKSIYNGLNYAYDAYTIHLEKDKYYRFYAESPLKDWAMNIYAIDPALKDGSLSNNSIAENSADLETGTAIAFGRCGEEKDYTLMLTAYTPYKLHDEPKYMLAFEEMQDFGSLMMGGVQEVVLPFRQDTAFGKVKYAGDDQWNWHPVYDYLSSYTIYSAAAYVAKVNAGDTLYASLTTDYDAVIHFFHFYGATAATETNPLICDTYEGFPQIAEKGIYVNTTDSVETIVIVASDNNYRPGSNHYHLILSNSYSDIDVEKGAYAEASESVIYCDQEMSIVRDALSRLTLTAKDENGLVIGTIDNIALYWNINLSTGIATYEVNDADLPNGYTFGGTAWIPVSVRSLETVFPMADKSSIVLTEYTESAAREALGAVVLTAIDADGKTVHTFTNTPADWTIDLTAGLATYTLQNTDLPRGYVFENATETVNVQLKNGSGIANVESNNAVRVYPNPASDYTFVEGASDEIRVYDLTGRLVLNQKSAGEKTMLDITSLPTGVYTVHTAGEVTPLMVK